MTMYFDLAGGSVLIRIINHSALNYLEEEMKGRTIIEKVHI